MNKQFEINNKVVIITGGAGMLGTRYANLVCDLGGIPIIIDIDKDKINKVVKKLKKKNINSFGYSANIQNESEIIKKKKLIIKKYKRIDILINNAALTAKGMSNKGSDFFKALEEYPLDLWEKLIDVNLTGHFICSKIFGKNMIKNRSGIIVNVSSEIGLISPDKRIYKGIKNPYSKGPLNNPPPYSATKAGLIQMSNYLSIKWAKYNVRVNSFCPGGVFDNHDKKFVKRYSNLVPMGRMAFKDEYLGPIAFLISNASYAINGKTLVVDGGKTSW